MQTFKKSITKNKRTTTFMPYTSLDFSEIDMKAKHFADIIETRFEDLTEILLKYESYEVVQDETERTLDLLRNLKENKTYFKLRIGAVASFLPRNQPLYAFSCFVIIPALMASEVHFRIPSSMTGFFPEMMKLLNISRLFPNIIISPLQRVDFLTERSALLLNPKTEETRPVTDAVIFTGNSVNASQLRLLFDKKTLFIANGSGHNPIVVSEDANIKKSLEAVLNLQFYNQGQDCAAPNSILVHTNVLKEFLFLLQESVKNVNVGHYFDRSCRVGPISEPKDLVRLQEFFVDNKEWLHPSTPGVIRTGESIVEPTIIVKSLIQGGNFREIFAPVIFVQEYKNDSELKLYFEDPRYAQNAMYVTLYGTNTYIKKIIGKPINGKILHKRNTYLHNTHLHVRGVERGTRPYGGYGSSASSISIHGEVISMPTLPQREIYERITKPLFAKKTISALAQKLNNFTSLQKKDVKKILRLKNNEPTVKEQDIYINDETYIDLFPIKTISAHYAKIKKTHIYRLLEYPNTEYIVLLKKEEISLIHTLKKLTEKKSSLSPDEFSELLYNIPKKLKETRAEDIERQSAFFQHIYELLFGKKYGPRLGHFLYDVEDKIINRLLDV